RTKRCLLESQPMITNQKSGQERTRSVHVEVVKRAGNDDPQHRWHAQNKQVRRALTSPACLRSDFGCAALRLMNHERKRRQQEPGQAGEIKCRAPTVSVSDKSA